MCFSTKPFETDLDAADAKGVNMRDLCVVSQRLRDVKEAYRNFLILGALEELTMDTRKMAIIAADIQKQASAAISDPHDRNWFNLYRGNILDD